MCNTCECNEMEEQVPETYGHVVRGGDALREQLRKLPYNQRRDERHKFESKIALADMGQLGDQELVTALREIRRRY